MGKCRIPDPLKSKLPRSSKMIEGKLRHHDLVVISWSLFLTEKELPFPRRRQLLENSFHAKAKNIILFGSAKLVVDELPSS